MLLLEFTTVCHCSAIRIESSVRLSTKTVAADIRALGAAVIDRCVGCTGMELLQKPLRMLCTARSVAVPAERPSPAFACRVRCTRRGTHQSRDIKFQGCFEKGVPLNVLATTVMIVVAVAAEESDTPLGIPQVDRRYRGGIPVSSSAGSCEDGGSSGGG